MGKFRSNKALENTHDLKKVVQRSVSVIKHNKKKDLRWLKSQTTQKQIPKVPSDAKME